MAGWRDAERPGVGGRRVVVLIAAAFAAASSFTPAGAEPAAAPTPTPSAPLEATTTTLSPPGVVLAPAGADDAGRRQAQTELARTERELRAAVAHHRRVSRDLPPLQRRRVKIDAEVARLTEADRVAGEALAAARARVRELAVAGYVIGGDVPPVDYILRSESPADLVRRHQLVKSATESKAVALDAYERAKADASAALLGALQESERVTAEIAQVSSEIAAAQAAVDGLRVDVEHRKQLLDVITAAAPAGESDIPRLFLDAYRRAAAALARQRPHCRVTWTAVAAIGKVEANHGRYRGARLALNGDVYPRIIGIPLDGTRGTRRIDDTDGGTLDLDTVYDRAVGPMQFIPSTWARIAQDGNSDGVRDANNAYDAALATAAYLCRAVPGGGLDAEEHVRKAFFSYNHSQSYVEHVYSWKHTYDVLAGSI